MEEGRELILQQKQLPNIMTYGLIISAILIIFSVEQLYKTHKYVELAITTAVFMAILFLIRWFRFK